jgi:hypothetical protein
LDIQLGRWTTAAIAFTVGSITLFGLMVLTALIGAFALSIFLALLLPLQAVPAIQALRIDDSLPSIVVESEELVIDHPAVFRIPVHIPRSQVHCVFLGPMDDDLLPPGLSPLPPGASLRQRLGHLNQTLNRGPLHGRFFSSTKLAPDISLGFNDRGLNLMVVFYPPVPIGSVTRHLGALRFFGGRDANLTFPSRQTIAHGIFACLRDVEAARDTFASASWPLVDKPRPSDLAWVGTAR